MGRKRLFFDIETSPNLGLFWQAGYKQRIDYSNIVTERKIICICYKWEDDPFTYALTWDKKMNDKHMLSEFIQVANTADELVGHNGDKFDLPWVRTRCLFHGIKMFPRYITIDTLKISRSQFKFNSNKLDYIAKYLGFKGKIETSYGLWKDIMLKNDTKALGKMVEYCREDVIQLEKIYTKIKNHTASKTHYGVVFNAGREGCPECGSDELTIHKNRISATGVKYIQYQCKTCGKYFQRLAR
jgi:uncharacterized protein YprB with RNaseH-like and TPR domain